MINTESRMPVSQRRLVWSIVVFVAIAILGIFYVKWSPYFGKAFYAASHHTIGASIVSGHAATAPSPSWKAAWGYMVSYGLDIWEALVVGLLMGAGVQTLIPRDWLMRVLGRTSMGSTITAGLAAVPAMM